MFESLKPNQDRKQVLGVVDENNLETFRNSAIGRCLNNYSLQALATEFRRKNLQGFSIMRIQDPLILLMFRDMETRTEIIRWRQLLQWFDNVQEWSADLRFDSRFTWLSIDGIPIQAWSTTTFKNIAESWGSFLKLDSDTAEPQSFECGRVFIETKRMERINETIDLVVNSEIFPVLIWEIEYHYRNEHSEDLSAGMSYEEEDSTHDQH
ncbi:hypothetical protein V6N13_093002 [Hibiscus sabdariffa]